MSESFTQKVSAIVNNEKRLEFIITKLIQLSVARHDISIQGSPTHLAEEYGVYFVEPDVIQDSFNPPKKEYFLQDDFGWVVGFATALPIFIGVILGVFIIGDIQSLRDNLLFGSLGVIVGGLIGFFISKWIRNRQRRLIEEQEKKGGFVIWVTVFSKQQAESVMTFLQKYNAHDITLHP